MNNDNVGNTGNRIGGSRIDKQSGHQSHTYMWEVLRRSAWCHLYCHFALLIVIPYLIYCHGRRCSQVVTGHGRGGIQFVSTRDATMHWDTYLSVLEPLSKHKFLPVTMTGYSSTRKFPSFFWCLSFKDFTAQNMSMHHIFHRNATFSPNYGQKYYICLPWSSSHWTQ